MVELVTIEIKTFVVFDKGLGFDRHLSKDYGLLVRFSSTVSGVSPIFSWSNRQLNHSRENGSAGETTNLCFFSSIAGTERTVIFLEGTHIFLLRNCNCNCIAENMR